MINIVGPAHVSGHYQLANESALTQHGDVFIHMYRKSESRPNRKLGHVTVIAPSLEALLERAEAIKNQLEIIAK
jgi:5-(carboxyamino)imidazole ribonucleotide synthase